MSGASEKIYVGTGEGKVSFEYAVSHMSQDGLTRLILDPGVYTIDGPRNGDNLSFEGTGNSPEDVVLNANLVVNGTNLNLYNLHINGTQEDYDVVHVLDKGQLVATNVVFTSQTRTNCVMLINSAAKLTDCALTSMAGKEFSLVADKGSEVTATGCDFGGFGLVQSRAALGTSLIRTFITIQDSSELTADALYVDDVQQGYTYFTIKKNSLISLTELHLPADTEEAGSVLGNAENSEIHVVKNNIDDDHQLIFTNIKQTSTIDVQGAYVLTEPWPGMG